MCSKKELLHVMLIVLIETRIVCMIGVCYVLGILSLSSTLDRMFNTEIGLWLSKLEFSPDS